MAKELDKLAAEIARLDAKLANEKFVAKAPPEVVADQRERRADANTARSRLGAALARLSAA